MAITLSEQVRNDTIRCGDDQFTLAAGERLQVRSGSVGSIDERLDEKVPAGKQWDVIVYVRVVETNA